MAYDIRPVGAALTNIGYQPLIAELYGSVFVTGSTIVFPATGSPYVLFPSLKIGSVART